MTKAMQVDVLNEEYGSPFIEADMAKIEQAYITNNKEYFTTSSTDLREENERLKAREEAEACYLHCEQMDSYGIIETIATALLAAEQRGMERAT